MPEYQRYFSLTARAPMSGIALTTRTGPVVETWNRRHDKNAGLRVTQRYCDGVLLTSNNGYREGTQWTLDFLMTGPLANDEKVVELTALMLEAIGTPVFEDSPVVYTSIPESVGG